MWQQEINRVIDRKAGGVLVLHADDEAYEFLTDSIKKRNYEVAEMARALVDPHQLVIVPQKVVTRERLAAELSERGLAEEDVWVYGAVLPRALVRRSMKIQVHAPLPGDAVPDWFDRDFPERVRETVLPGYSCFSVEAVHEAVERLLERYAAVRLKDPRGASGEGQAVVTDPEALGTFLDRMREEHAAVGGLEGGVREFGLVAEANLEAADAWSMTLTRTPHRHFASIGRQCDVEVRQPDGTTLLEYSGTSSVTVRGGPEHFFEAAFPECVLVEDPVRRERAPEKICPDEAVVRAAGQYIEAMRAWEAEGAVRTRANVDVVRGTLVRRDGTREQVTCSVEDSARPGGASPAEILGALDLARDPDLPYAVYTTRHVFDPDEAAAYRRHIERTGRAAILWDGVDASWGGKYVMFCVF